jgi:hypothetical protein
MTPTQAAAPEATTSRTKQALDDEVGRLRHDLDAVRAGENQLAKVWRAAIARIARILVLNGQVERENRVTDQMIAGYFVEHHLLVKTDGHEPTGREIHRHLSLAKWATPDALASEQEQARLRNGIEIDGRKYHNSLDALEHSGLAWSGVYQVMAAEMRQARRRETGRGGARNVLPSRLVATKPDEIGAVDKFLEHAVIRRATEPSRDNQYGVETVPLKHNQTAALGMMLALARNFAWTDEQRREVVAAMQEKNTGHGKAA